ncbi:AraC family transcriptional regulator [Trinickia symbiotica]|uniref:AraC family transcriptional regulator n=1 Tax=Trinickia symbiotica TaxID=863227 RepID=A0A2N7X4D9_9BURK|nr:AraC family transcriptional regulator [Trinickia symbiotica]PMS36638.1 AraC family transcriptional regulator [Trinickia symbiotica]PPK46063.1 AraC family transcriptional regulator [Trinickia symbiotica]
MKAVTSSLIPDSATRVSLHSSASLGWSGFGAQLLGIAAGLHRIPALDVHRIGVHVGAPVRADCRCDGKRSMRIQAHGDTNVIPAGLEGEWRDDASCTVLQIWMTDEFVRNTFDQLGLRASDAQIRYRDQVRDPRLEHLTWALRAELEAEDASDPLYAESLCTAIVVRLAAATASPSQRRRTLMPRAAARVTDYIEAHLEERLTLASLASLVQLSVPHFKVLFRETFGLPVHRYVVERRVEHAKALLIDGRLSASQVALEVGFAHQSHMASWMKRLLGVTPRDIAREDAAQGGRPLIVSR